MQKVGGTGWIDAGLGIEIFDGSIGRQRVSVLGMELVSQFNLVFDKKNRDLYLAPNSRRLARSPD